MTRRAFAGAALGALAALAAGGGNGGCRKARSPEEAFRRFAAAVAAGDPGALFNALDKRSRWAWQTVQKSHREAYDIILSNYPEGAERMRELRRFERGATLGSARELFIEELGRAALGRLRPMAEPAAGLRFENEPGGERAIAVLTSGARAPFKRGPDGGWGFAGFADESEDRQNRALQDVEVVRTSAADYERAAALKGR